MPTISDTPVPAGESLIVVTRTLWGEARGEGEAGIEAVAAVLANRAKAARAFKARHGRPHPLFGDGTLTSACLVNHNDIWQFTSWDPRDPNRPKMLAADATTPMFAVCRDIASRYIAGTMVDPTQGAVNYLDPAETLRLYGRLPDWVAAMRQTVTIGHHAFYAEAAA